MNTNQKSFVKNLRTSFKWTTTARLTTTAAATATTTAIVSRETGDEVQAQ
jgi:hypothetical protein